MYFPSPRRAATPVRSPISNPVTKFHPQVEILEGRVLPSTTGTAPMGVLVETSVASVVVVRIQVVSAPSIAPNAAIAASSPGGIAPAEAAASLRLNTTTVESRTDQSAHAPDAFISSAAPTTPREAFPSAANPFFFTLTPWAALGLGLRTNLIKPTLPDVVVSDYGQVVSLPVVTSAGPLDQRINAPLPTVVRAIVNRMEFLGGGGGANLEFQPMATPSPAPLPQPRPVAPPREEAPALTPILQKCATATGAADLAWDGPIAPDLVESEGEDQPIAPQDLVSEVAALMVSAGIYPLAQTFDEPERRRALGGLWKGEIV